MIAIFITSIRDLSFDFKLSFENLSMQFRLKRVFYISWSCLYQLKRYNRRGLFNLPESSKESLEKDSNF